MKKPWNAHTGKPLAKEGFMKWTDVSTDRWQTTVHNFFGETIQIHQDYLLEDTLRSRPVIVKYRWWINYIAEFLIITLFIIGIWFGRKNRYLLKHANGQLLNTLRMLLVCLTAWLWLYNGWLLTKYVLL